jgi:type IV pilus assembly protein PilQ
MKTNAWIFKFLLASLLLGLSVFSNFLKAEDQSNLANKIESIDFATLPGGRVNIILKTTQPLANPQQGFH